MRLTLFLSILVVPAFGQSITTPEALIRAAHDRYARTWYRSVTFTQRTVETNQDGTKKESIWYEQLQVPGKLSIRFDPRNEGSGILFARDSIFSFDKGELKLARPLVHSLVLLGFDVYGLAVERTVEKLRELNYDLSVLHETMWKDRPAYVVGARKGDDTTKQFWFDKERLVLVRTLEKNPRAGFISEVQFNKYLQVDGGWIETEVLFLRNGKVVTEEYYADIKTNVAIDQAVYDPLRWKEGMRE